MITYVFPGQGAQRKGMGEKLFDEFPEMTQKADEILGYSIKELCLEDPEEKLNLTEYTQPALYVVNALSYYKKIRDKGQKPDFLADHSLGEYNAILAAGGFDFETGLKLVRKRGELMGRATGGGMAAVIGFTKDKVIEILDQYELADIDIANLNTATQIVISGYQQDIERAKDVFEQKGVSVRWAESIGYLLRQGEMEFAEIGPGHVLTNMIRKIKAETILKQPETRYTQETVAVSNDECSYKKE